MNGFGTLLLACTLSVSCWFNTVISKNDAETAQQSSTAIPQLEQFFPENHAPTLLQVSFTTGEEDKNPEAQYKLCISEYEQGHEEAAIAWCEKAAQKGQPEAQYVAGSIYLFTQTPSESTYKRAEQWLLRAAEQGHSGAAKNLVLIYHYGLAGKKDPLAAEKWYLSAAEGGSDMAQLHLGTLYARGNEGVPQDYNKALYWFEKSAIQDNAEAQHNLSAMYLYGYGVTKDINAAFFWVQKSAENGQPDAQYNLGMMYYFGSGTKTDDKLAIKWLNKAAMNGVVDAQLQLGYMYFYREAIGDMPPEESITMAYMYYSLAAQQQNAEAIHHIAVIESYLDAKTFEKVENAAQLILDKK